jgi:hypothetical protein
MMFVLDLLALCAAATFLVLLAHTGDPTRPRWLFAALPVGALVLWGIAWTWFPPLANWRLGPSVTGAPSALPTLAMVAGLSVLLSLLALTPIIQRAVFAQSNRSAVLALGSWRTVFGLGLIMVGLNGGLPPGFFWSAGIGDIVAGLISTFLLARGTEVSDRAWLTWNVIGLADLIHVLALAAIYVRPFFEANPTLPALNLVPLIIVPVFIALHVGALRQALGRLQNTASANSSRSPTAAVLV